MQGIAEQGNVNSRSTYLNVDMLALLSQPNLKFIQRYSKLLSDNPFKYTVLKQSKIPIIPLEGNRNPALPQST